MKAIQTLAELEKNTGISQARLRNYLKGHAPDAELGRVKGYSLNRVRTIVAAKHSDVLALLNLSYSPEGDGSA